MNHSSSCRLRAILHFEQLWIVLTHCCETIGEIVEHTSLQAKCRQNKPVVVCHFAIRNLYCRKIRSVILQILPCNTIVVCVENCAYIDRVFVSDSQCIWWFNRLAKRNTVRLHRFAFTSSAHSLHSIVVSSEIAIRQVVV